MGQCDYFVPHFFIIVIFACKSVSYMVICILVGKFFEKKV